MTDLIFKILFTTFCTFLFFLIGFGEAGFITFLAVVLVWLLFWFTINFIMTILGGKCER